MFTTFTDEPKTMSTMKQTLQFLLRNRRLLVFFVFTLLAVFLPLIAEARMGGAGGGSDSGGGGGDGIGALIFYIIMLIPFPWNLVVIAALIVLYFIAKKKAKQRSILNSIPTAAKVGQSGASNVSLPGLDVPVFTEKVKTAFVQLQEAWAAKNMGKVRRYISDGMYQRLNIQFKMMDMLKQRNEITKIEVKGVYLDKAYQDGGNDVVHVAVHAVITDKFISEEYKQLVSGGREEFVEYWSFIRKTGVAERDMYHTLNCPNCGGELPLDGGEVSKCPYCGTITNSGAYDWVLAEITQVDDYKSTNVLHDLSRNLGDRVAGLADDYPDFSVQHIEDITSNGFLQIETARVLRKPEMMRRFVSNELFERLDNEIKNATPFLYNRIFLNDVTLIGGLTDGNQNKLTVSVKMSYQRVRIDNKTLTIVDPQVTTQTRIVILSRDAKAQQPKASLYAHQCPSCGGTLSDTTDLNCPYCGSTVNSTMYEWIISDVMDLSAYTNFYKENYDKFAAGVKPGKIDSLYKVRDFAFNNVLIMIAADGKFTQEEVEFANDLAKKWGYNTDKIQGMIELARTNQLTIKMPEDMKDREKIYKLMEKAANIDNDFDPAEKALLEHIKKEYLNGAA